MTNAAQSCYVALGHTKNMSGMDLKEKSVSELLNYEVVEKSF